ncbi:MAG TPA: 23S rRNA (adenine(2503)-C(2))-methyltransferase RlmN [Polyangiaceae bacterium]|nr:23S rRNA (adenine(2503)-C(2))-methyltransferase RlmN [Polyangiaceae bacterium]
MQPGPVAALARTPEEWAAALRPLGGRHFHARQLFRWMHERGILDPQQMTDLPGHLRSALSELGVERSYRVIDVHRSVDRTRKLLLQLRDGATVETVLIPAVSAGPSSLPSPLADARPVARSMPREQTASDTAGIGMDNAGTGDADASAAVDDEDPEVHRPGAGLDGERGVRVTQCVSSQVGCAMGCIFCASGVAGLRRHLGADEIVAQILVGRTQLEPDETLTNVVFMGMGEPLHNYEATVRALRLLIHPGGIGLSPRRITVSTSGLVPEIARLGADFEGSIGLAVSLHAADDATRSRLMPINKKYPLPMLMDALRAYPLPRRRRITIEYTLVSGKNDGVDAAKKLARLLRGIAVKVNLIPMNPIGASALGPPDLGSVLEFQRVLCDAGYSCFIRRRRGDDVSAACGQLAILGAKPKVRVSRS